MRKKRSFQRNGKKYKTKRKQKMRQQEAKREKKDLYMKNNFNGFQTFKSNMEMRWKIREKG